MQIISSNSFLLSAVLAVVVLSAAHSQTTRPGHCNAKKPCASSDDFTCVSVANTIPGLEQVSQCSLVPVCAGKTAGACPTFTSWPEEYQKIEPICAFSQIQECVSSSSSSSLSSSSSTSGKNEDAEDEPAGTVECFSMTVKDGNETRLVRGIYQCMDKQMYLAGDAGFTKELTEAQMKACAGENDAAKLCNGHGTCKPVASFSSKYECQCSTGYGGTNCNEVTSNGCQSLGECGTGGKCDLTQKKCVCDKGVVGNQCTKCDATSTDACSKHGTCNKDSGKCKCAEGYSGVFCEVSASDKGCEKKSDCPYATQVCTDKKCQCQPGFKGAKCDQCDDKSPLACGGEKQGKCQNGKCVCEKGFQLGNAGCEAIKDGSKDNNSASLGINVIAQMALAFFCFSYLM